MIYQLQQRNRKTNERTVIGEFNTKEASTDEIQKKIDELKLKHPRQPGHQWLLLGHNDDHFVPGWDGKIKTPSHPQDPQAKT